MDVAQLIGSTADSADKDPNLQNGRMEVIGTVPSTLSGMRKLSRIVFSHLFTNSVQGHARNGHDSNVGVVFGIVLAWLLTLPCAALINGIVYWLVRRAGTV